ncbi:hypothetical protein BV898_13525 [Hypsibius exemplaris]|uniref:Uncharacterized protein n=1 Tax=Hypsibius exemplaris TaxID=2072580 RepID=A0A1W0WAK4_HYPEX|nr:hypothetical protein BV898_13525 [Hypsibius exemplaris]
MKPFLLRRYADPVLHCLTSGYSGAPLSHLGVLRCSTVSPRGTPVLHCITSGYSGAPAFQTVGALALRPYTGVLR